MTAPTCYCAGCVGMGPCDNPPQSDECGNCALEADHFGPCAWTCNGCGREWRVLPAEWAVQVVTVAGLEREGGAA